MAASVLLEIVRCESHGPPCVDLHERKGLLKLSEELSVDMHFNGCLERVTFKYFTRGGTRDGWKGILPNGRGVVLKLQAWGFQHPSDCVLNNEVKTAKDARMAPFVAEVLWAGGIQILHKFKFTWYVGMAMHLVLHERI